MALAVQGRRNHRRAIPRDTFGQPRTITRSGTYAGSAISSVRTFVYDGSRRVCKRIDPESGVTLMDYDNAGNLAWTATASARR